MTIAQIKKSKIYSPGLLDGKIVNFLPSVKKTFYVQNKGEAGYARDQNNKYIILDIDKVIQARFEYMEIYADAEKAEMIQKEIERLQDELVKKAQRIIDSVELAEAARDRRPAKGQNFTQHVLQQAMYAIGPSEMDKNENQAKLYFARNPDAIKLKEGLIKLVDDKDYISLHYLFIKFGEPVASFSVDGDITALINTFHADKIAETMDRAQENPLYLQAKINVELKLTPNK